MQAESVGELIEARTVGAADSALAGLKGGIGETICHLRGTCMDILVELEVRQLQREEVRQERVQARLDFDEDMPEIDTAALLQRIEQMQETVESCLKTASRGRLLRQGLQIAIVGRPNVGKSSLMNAWSGVDKAIVTEIPGTTRDIVEADLSVHGVPVTLLDTAGIREGTDLVERMGIERAAATARGADVIVMVMDVNDGWTESDAAVFQGLWEDRARIPAPGYRKAPALPLTVSETFESVVLTSALRQEGLEDLDAAVMKAMEQESVMPGGVAWAVNERQSEALFRAHESLERVVESINSEMPMDLWTIDLRDVLLSLGEISGEDVKEEILDNIFQRFCIGK